MVMQIRWMGKVCLKDGWEAGMAGKRWQGGVRSKEAQGKVCRMVRAGWESQVWRADWGQEGMRRIVVEGCGR